MTGCLMDHHDFQLNQTFGFFVYTSKFGYPLRVGASPEKTSPARKCSVPGAEFVYSLPEKHNIKKLGQFSYENLQKYRL